MIDKKIKCIEYLLITLLILSIIFINHLKFGNSHHTRSQYEMTKYYINQYRKRKKAKKLANHIYSRILYWQNVHEEWNKNE